MRLERKVVVGHWRDAEVQERVGAWARAACAKRDWETGRIARFGDNMREVAVTEGDKVEAQRRLGFSVNTLWRRRPRRGRRRRVRGRRRRADRDLPRRVRRRTRRCARAATGPASLRDGARIEIGLRRFLDDGGFTAFTTTFEDLHGLTQLPGLAVQRLMRDGYGFGAEGDWKTAAMVRAMKVMTSRPAGRRLVHGGLHLPPRRQRRPQSSARTCSRSASRSRPARPRLEIHPLSIGGKADPVRLVFDAHPGPAVVASIMDMGQRFRMVATVVDVVAAEQPLPRLPVARAVWRPRPDLQTNAAAWILRRRLAPHEPRLRGDARAPRGLRGDVRDRVPAHRRARPSSIAFRDQLRWNDLYYLLARGL